MTGIGEGMEERLLIDAVSAQGVGVGFDIGQHQAHVRVGVEHSPAPGMIKPHPERFSPHDRAFTASTTDMYPSIRAASIRLPRESGPDHYGLLRTIPW